MSSGHNTNRGRNGSNNGGSGSNGGNSRRARRTLSHQRNPAAQSILQHRADSGSASAPARMSEVSASLEQEESIPRDADRMNPTSKRGEAALGLPLDSVPPVAADPTNGDEDSPSQPEAYLDRLDSSADQPRSNRRSPQLIPSSPSVSTGVHATKDSTSSLNSIRAPFAPGHNHLPPANNLRPAFPPTATDSTVSSGRNGTSSPLRRHHEGTSPSSESSWGPAPAKRVR